MSDLINPIQYGVLDTGFSRMRFPEIRQSIVNSLQENTGITFETRPDSITGQFIDTFAERETVMWELAEAVYHAMYPISATGINLDHSVSFAGVRRLFAERSTAWVALYGDEGTTISSGSIIRNNSTQDSFNVDQDVTISRQIAIDFTVAITTAVVGQEYWVSIDGAYARYVCQASDTQFVIAQSLWTQMLSTGLQVSIDGNNIRGYSLESIPFQLQFSTNITLLTIASPGNVTAEDFGIIDVSADSLDIIVTTQTGWDSVNNIVPGHTGRELETDDELRQRYASGVYRLGAGTVESIKTNIEQNVPGILTVQVYENENDVADSEGRLPHSIEVIAYGGDPIDVADQIWLTKAAGIDTNGSIVVQVKDSSGYYHDIHFNRPTPVYLWVKVDTFLYNEEVFPDNGEQQIQAIVTDTGNSFGIGKDIIIQRLLGPIYAQVPGISRMDIKIARTIDPNVVPAPGVYTTNNIAISARELSIFDVTHVDVTIESSTRR